MLKPPKIFGKLRDTGIKPDYLIFQIANNKGADQTARMLFAIKSHGVS